MNTPTTAVTKRRSEVLTAFLDEIGAHPINAVKGPNGSALTFYAVAGTVMIVQRFAEGLTEIGFELYIPPTRRNDLEAVFTSARKALEVK